MAKEIYVEQKVVTQAKIIDELKGLAIPGVKDYSIFGLPGQCAGVYAWTGPDGIYEHATVSDADAERIRQAITDHVADPEVSADEELAQAIEAATTLAELKAALLGNVRPAKVMSKAVSQEG